MPVEYPVFAPFDLARSLTAGANIVNAQDEHQAHLLAFDRMGRLNKAHAEINALFGPTNALAPAAGTGGAMVLPTPMGGNAQAPSAAPQRNHRSCR